MMAYRSLDLCSTMFGSSGSGSSSSNYESSYSMTKSHLTIPLRLLTCSAFCAALDCAAFRLMLCGTRINGVFSVFVGCLGFSSGLSFASIGVMRVEFVIDTTCIRSSRMGFRLRSRGFASFLRRASRMVALSAPIFTLV